MGEGDDEDDGRDLQQQPAHADEGGEVEGEEGHAQEDGQGGGGDDLDPEDGSDEAPGGGALVGLGGEGPGGETEDKDGQQAAEDEADAEVFGDEEPRSQAAAAGPAMDVFGHVTHGSR